jgi:hypothetical protein
MVHRGPGRVKSPGVSASSLPVRGSEAIQWAQVETGAEDATETRRSTADSSPTRLCSGTFGDKWLAAPGPSLTVRQIS